MPPTRRRFASADLPARGGEKKNRESFSRAPNTNFYIFRLHRHQNTIKKFHIAQIQSLKRIETAINRSFNSVANTISRAAVSGKLSINQMVSSILADFERVAISQFIVKPIEGVVSSIASSLIPVGGARASGGPVAADVPSLVGEQGPELFVPSSNGAIAPNNAL